MRVIPLKLFILGIILMVPSISFCGSSRFIKGNGLKKEDTAAININFNRIDNELSNVVHKTSTETIRGTKYFTNVIFSSGVAIPSHATPDASVRPTYIYQIIVNTSRPEVCISTGTNSGAWVRCCNATDMALACQN